MDKIPAAGSSAAQPSFDTAGASFDMTMEDEPTPTPNKVVGTLDPLAGHEIVHTKRLACSCLFAVTNQFIVQISQNLTSSHTFPTIQVSE